MRLGRLGLIVLAMLVLSLAVVAHKTPLVQYTKVGMQWESGYSYSPRQPVIGEPITIHVSAEHPGDTIEGEVRAEISVYYDGSSHQWFGGKPYKNPEWTLIKHVEDAEYVGEVVKTEYFKGVPVRVNRKHFETGVVVDQPGSYVVIINWYNDGQYIGEHNMLGLDVEYPHMGPMYYGLLFIIIAGVIIGVKRRIL